MKKIHDAVIVAYGRTPIARAKKGALKDLHPADYAAGVIQGILKKVPQVKLADIDDLVLGCAKPEGIQSYNLARQVVQRSELPDSVSGQTITRFCSSGIQAITTAANTIMLGQADILLAGGVESMSAIPMGSDPANQDKWLKDHRPDIYMAMGMTAENVAARYKLTRTQLDAFAVESQNKAAAAQAAGKFKKEIIPIEYTDDSGQKKIFSEDEGIRAGTTVESLAGLKPFVKDDGIVTAGNSSSTNDGAAFVLLMSAEKAKALGLKPIARFLGAVTAGLAPNIMGLGPIFAVPKLLKQTGLAITDFDIIEINEAFAAQAIPCVSELKLDKTKVNPRGGAIALGHPLGATGAILTCKALSYLEDTKGQYALITMCVGGGMGYAAAFEMV